MGLSSYAKISRSVRRLGRQLSFGSDSTLSLCDNDFNPIVTGVEGWLVIDQGGNEHNAWLVEFPEASATREQLAQVSTAVLVAHGKTMRFRTEEIPQQIIGEPKLQLALIPINPS